MRKSIRIGRINVYGPRKAEWWIWLPSILWHRQGAAWCLDMAWLNVYATVYWNDQWP